MRRHLSWIFAGTLLLGGLAACSDDDDSGDDTTTTTVADDSGDDTTTTEGDSGDSGDASGDPEVQAYCDDVRALAQEIEDAGIAALADYQDELTALNQSGTELAQSDISAEDAQAVADCTQELATAATGG